MSSISKITEDIVNRSPFLREAMTENLINISSLARKIKPEIETIEVGWITYAKNLQRTVEATEAMYLMMKNVFENLGYRRYEWKCGSVYMTGVNDIFRGSYMRER